LANYYLYSPAIAGGSFEKAEEYAQQVEKRDPFNGALVGTKIRERQERWADAATCYRRALALRPQDASLHAGLGNALARAGETEAARAAFDEALKLKPDLAAARTGLRALETPKKG
jgi:Flp pilus assembly protein TadD